MHKRQPVIAAGGQYCGCIFKSLSIVANVQQLQLFIHLNRKLCSVSIENRDMKVVRTWWCTLRVSTMKLTIKCGVWNENGWKKGCRVNHTQKVFLKTSGLICTSVNCIINEKSTQRAQTSAKQLMYPRIVTYAYFSQILFTICLKLCWAYFSFAEIIHQ